MVEINKMILNMINDGYSIQEIRDKLDLSYKELNTRLNQIKRSGYEFLESYFNNGELYYSINRDLELYKDNNYTNINIKEHTSSFHFIAIADTHFGHINDSMHMIYNLYDYADINGINSVVNAGDLIEGDFTNQKYVRNKSTESQLNYIFNNYPYSDKIMNYILLGNHDHHSLSYDGLNLKNVLNNKRYDFIVLGYGIHTLCVRGVNINLKHQLNGENLGHLPSSDLTLYGHSHGLKMDIGDSAHIYLPTCSLVAPGNDDIDKFNVGALDINLKLQDNNSKTIEIKELETLPKVKVKNIITYRIGQIKNNRKK